MPISWLDHKPHAIAVYASWPALPSAHATLATGRPATALPGPVLHRLDCTSFCWRLRKRRLSYGLDHVDPQLRSDIPAEGAFHIKFAGYVAQQYIQKTTAGVQRGVAAYEVIMRRIPKSVKQHFVDKLQSSEEDIVYEIGTIPNLYSLIPMSQTAHKPIFALKAKDGVRGAHFSKVKDAETIFKKVANQLLKNISSLSS